MQLSSLFDKTTSKDTDDVGPGAATVERVFFLLPK